MTACLVGTVVRCETRALVLGLGVARAVARSQPNAPMGCWDCERNLVTQGLPAAILSMGSRSGPGPTLVGGIADQVAAAASARRCLYGYLIGG
jgi:hypothetical protein